MRLADHATVSRAGRLSLAILLAAAVCSTCTSASGRSVRDVRRVGPLPLVQRARPTRHFG
jgi:hypothetical protein